MLGVGLYRIFFLKIAWANFPLIDETAKEWFLPHPGPSPKGEGRLGFIVVCVFSYKCLPKGTLEGLLFFGLAPGPSPKGEGRNKNIFLTVEIGPLAFYDLMFIVLVMRIAILRNLKAD